MRKTFTRFAPLAAVVLLAACGGGDEPEDTPVEAEPTEDATDDEAEPAAP